MKRFLVAALAACALWLGSERSPVVAGYACPQAHTFVTGETLSASVLNANPATFANCFANIALPASSISASSASLGTFPGSFPYTFNSPLIVSPPGVSLPTLIQGDAAFIRSGSANGKIWIGSGSLDSGISNANTITSSQAFWSQQQLSSSGAVVAGCCSAPPPFYAGDLVGSRASSQGAVILGGATNSAMIDYGVTTPGVVTVSAPMAASGIIGGNISASGLNIGTAHWYVVTGGPYPPCNAYSIGSLMTDKIGTIGSTLYVCGPTGWHGVPGV
jgi:hypothetical protein